VSAARARVLFKPGQKPGPGRPKGVPNKVTGEAKAFCQNLVADPEYRKKLRADFLHRRCSDQIEKMIWHYGVGVPRIPVDASLSFDLARYLETGETGEP
jgi:hypothetical protein